MKTNPTIFRKDQIGMKTFYSFTRAERNEYIKSLLKLPQQERSTVDNHILRYNNMMPEEPVKNWLSIEG